jgi:predicted AlkP superfamily phosphohydrolase/phosphomutase
MMGPPTTVPAPEVDGFFVSGAGGGYSPDGGIPEAACHPSSILDTLQEHECRWETRFGASGIRDQDEFFEELIKTVENRADAYTTLCDSHDPGFGFFVQKENVVVQNLLMSEIQSMINDGENRKIHGQISDFYTTLDRTISEICEGLNPENVVLVSDHGQAAYRHTVNLNQFLKQEGFQEPPASITSYPTSLARKAGSGLPSPVKSFIRSHFAGAVEEVAKPEVDWEKSASFSFRYIPGVYINDARFDGPVDDSEREEKITRIISRFNNSSISDEFGLRAVEYRSEHIDAEKEELLPDIWIEHPDTMFFEAHGELVRPNEAYGKVEDFTEINRDMYTGIKGETPIVCVKDDSGKESLESDRDLTLAYELITQKLRF